MHMRREKARAHAYSGADVSFVSSQCMRSDSRELANANEASHMSVVRHRSNKICDEFFLSLDGKFSCSSFLVPSTACGKSAWFFVI